MPFDLEDELETLEKNGQITPEQSLIFGAPLFLFDESIQDPVAQLIYFLRANNLYRPGDLTLLLQHPDKLEGFQLIILAWMRIYEEKNEKMPRKILNALFGITDYPEDLVKDQEMESGVFSDFVLMKVEDPDFKDAKLNDLTLVTRFIKAYQERHYPKASQEVYQAYQKTNQKNAKRTKEQALEKTILEISLIMKDQKKSCTYLSGLENEIKKLAGGVESYPSSVLKTQPYTFEQAWGLEYPVPGKDFKVIKLNHLLSRALMNRLSRHGFRREKYKLFGYIDQSVMIKLIRAGVYFTENSLIPSFNLHGKVTHMLHSEMIGSMMDSGDLPIHYDNDKKLTLGDILDYLTTPNSLCQGKMFWDLLLDSGSLVPAYFRNPYYFHTYLMKNGAQNQLPELSAALCLSFLKSMVYSATLYSQLLKEPVTPQTLSGCLMTLDEPTSFASLNPLLFVNYRKNAHSSQPVKSYGDLKASSPWIVAKKELASPETPPHIAYKQSS